MGLTLVASGGWASIVAHRRRRDRRRLAARIEARIADLAAPPREATAPALAAPPPEAAASPLDLPAGLPGGAIPGEHGPSVRDPA